MSKGGRRKDKETAYSHYIDGYNGVVLTAGMFRKNDKNPADKQIFASEMMWQSWVHLAKIEGRAPSHLRTVGQYFVVNGDTKQIIRDALQYSSDTGHGPEPGQVEWTPYDNGFFALLGSPNGKVVSRMLLDHKCHNGHKTIERIILVGNKDKHPSEEWTRTFLVMLLATRKPPPPPTKIPDASKLDLTKFVARKPSNRRQRPSKLPVKSRK